MKTELIAVQTRSETFNFSSLASQISFFPCVSLAVPYWNSETYRSMLRCFISGGVVDGTDLIQLRTNIASALGVENVLLCGSGSLALEIALRAYEIGPGDEVVIPTFCCAAIVAPILAVGAIPVLADAGDELNMTQETVAAVITRKTRAIIVPHLFGNPADIEPVVELARSRNIHVIDDAAQALGATLDDRPVGSFGDAGILSFGREKVCFGLGGGALVARGKQVLANFSLNKLDLPRLLPALQKLSSTLFAYRWRRWTLAIQRASARSNFHDPAPPISSYGKERMSNLSAAVARSLMESLPENLSARRARTLTYQELLKGVAGLELIPHRAGSACLTQVARIRPRRRGRDIAAETIGGLGRAGYEIQGSYVPIHLLGTYPQCVWDRLPNAERIWADLIELPCEPSVKLADVDRIAAIVKKSVAM